MLFENPTLINRNAVFIEPTVVFLEWARKFPDHDLELTLDELREDNTAYLIPEQEDNSASWLSRNFKHIFEIELEYWCSDKSLWPKDRSFKSFERFFDVHFSSEVLDLGHGSIEKEYV